MSHLTRLIRFARHWHARIGVLAAIFFFPLALTGMALNHTESLKLDSRQVASPWLMHWYGLKARTPEQGYPLAKGYFVWDDQHWSMEGRLLPVTAQPVIGVVEVSGLRYVATPLALYLFQPDGTLVDKLSDNALPVKRLVHIGASGSELLVQGDQGIFATADSLEWQHYDQAATWSKPQPLPRDEQARIAAQFAPSLPLERVLLDVHSGRILGSHGPLLMDLAALVLLALSTSGVWIYLRSIRRRP